MSRLTRHLLCLSLATLSACESYDSPPEVDLLPTESGLYFEDDALVLGFTEPIDPASLVVTIWESKPDGEGNLPTELAPLVDACTPAASPCGVVTLTMNEDNTRATITQNGAFSNLVAKPLRLRVAAGLEDLAGRTRKVPTDIDFQISLPCENAAIPDFLLDSGMMTLVADVEGLPSLHLIIDLATDLTTGRAVITSTLGRVDTTLDPKPGASSANPAAHFPVLDGTGFGITVTACINPLRPGEYLLRTVPRDIAIKVGTLEIGLDQFELVATIQPGGASGLCEEGEPAYDCSGRDFASGTMFATEATLGDASLGAKSGSWRGFSFTPAEVDKYPAFPRVCEPDACADLLAAGGDCQLGNPWDANAVVFEDGTTATVCPADGQ